MSLRELESNQYKSIKVAFADDCVVQQTILKKLILSDRCFELVCYAGNGMDLIRKIKGSETLIDICILDIEMPVMDGIETALYLKTYFPLIKVVGFTSSKQEEKWRSLFQNGALAIIEKGEVFKLLDKIKELV